MYDILHTSGCIFKKLYTAHSGFQCRVFGPTGNRRFPDGPQKHVIKSPVRSGSKPYKFIRFGAMDVTKPYKFRGLGAHLDPASVWAQRSSTRSCRAGCYKSARGAARSWHAAAQHVADATPRRIPPPRGLGGGSPPVSPPAERGDLGGGPRGDGGTGPQTLYIFRVW